MAFMATRIVTVHEAKTRLSQLLVEVESGEEIVIARGKEPCAMLVPLPREGHRKLGFLTLEIPDSFFTPLPEDELDAWGQ